MTDDAVRQRWLLLIYRVPQEPPGRRTYAWRHLKQLGAVYLQQAAAILPDRPDLADALAALAGRIRGTEGDGDVSLLVTTSPDAAWERELCGRFNAARDAEYAELVKNVERLEDDIRRETRKGKFTFAELEDIEADGEKLHGWLGRIAARDFFGAAGRDEAQVALERGREALAQFAAAVYTHEGVHGTPAAGPAPGVSANDGGTP